MSIDIELQIITNARFDCVFDPDGICAVHGTSIMDHDAITKTEWMTLAEAKRRYPDTIWPKEMQ